MRRMWKERGSGYVEEQSKGGAGDRLRSLANLVIGRRKSGIAAGLLSVHRL